MVNTYATIKLQVLPNLLTSAFTRKISAHSIFETRLLAHCCYTLRDMLPSPDDTSGCISRIFIF
jgi:hypothetical protein